MAKKSIATEIVELFSEEGVMCFKDQYQEAYALLPPGCCHGVPLRSREFRNWIANFAYHNLGKVPNSQTLSSVCTTLEGKTYDSARLPLHIRIANFTSKIYYDMGNKKFVEIDSAGWRIEDSSPVWFRSPMHQKEQVKPIEGGDINELLKFVNFSEEARQSRRDIILLIWIVASFIPDFPHPVLVVHGPHGSAKSTLFRLIKELIDPSSLTTLSPASQNSDFVISAVKHWFIPLDNLSYLSDWMSDAICRACTGDGISKRELFTNTDEVIFNFRRIVGINGINLVVDKPDLLDRSILVELKALPPEHRRSEMDFWRDFEGRKPYILGAIFDVLAGALREEPNVHLSKLPRMADFVKWGCAIAKAMGLSEEDFLRAYEENIKEQHLEAVEASPISNCIIEFMSGRNYWECTPTDLMGHMNEIAERLRIDVRSKFWPRDPSWLWKRMVVARSNLSAIGIEIERSEKQNHRTIIIKRAPNAVNTVDAVGPTAAQQIQHFWPNGS